MEILQALLLSESRELQHRGAAVALNLMKAERGLAQELMESEALEILSVLAKGGAPEQGPVAKLAQHCLDTAVQYGLIKSNRSDGREGMGP